MLPAKLRDPNHPIHAIPLIDSLWCFTHLRWSFFLYNTLARKIYQTYTVYSRLQLSGKTRKNSRKICNGHLVPGGQSLISMLLVGSFHLNLFCSLHSAATAYKNHFWCWCWWWCRSTFQKRIHLARFQNCKSPKHHTSQHSTVLQTSQLQGLVWKKMTQVLRKHTLLSWSQYLLPCTSWDVWIRCWFSEQVFWTIAS